ncbi:hypothetical protein PR048_014542 [Dryococelus australis]|uniref:NYN domain-containing protein n=1 Tax=Dryococelus australis TaxID=614101 RepID=A0ABQ9HEP9_9NEOP|nr:hypothetical protein PR048_014542 [Dryococelus australis]
MPPTCASNRDRLAATTQDLQSPANWQPKRREALPSEVVRAGATASGTRNPEGLVPSLDRVKRGAPLVYHVVIFATSYCRPRSDFFRKELKNTHLSPCNPGRRPTNWTRLECSERRGVANRHVIQFLSLFWSGSSLNKDEVERSRWLRTTNLRVPTLNCFSANTSSENAIEVTSRESCCHVEGGRGIVVIRSLASHHAEPGLIPGRVKPKFPQIKTWLTFVSPLVVASVTLRKSTEQGGTVATHWTRIRDESGSIPFRPSRFRFSMVFRDHSWRMQESIPSSSFFLYATCSVCNDLVVDETLNSSGNVEVRRGLNTILQASLERNDNKHLHLSECIQDVDFVHFTQRMGRCMDRHEHSAVVDEISEARRWFDKRMWTQQRQFDEMGTVCSSCNREFVPEEEDAEEENATFGHNAIHIIGGGHLLNCVVWPRAGTYGDIMVVYKCYIEMHFGKGTIVIFDGYPDTPTTKGEAHSLHYQKHVPFVLFNDSTYISHTQSDFLANSQYKRALIRALITHLRKASNELYQATADSDIQIICVALQHAADGKCVIVVGQDTDLLVLLTVLSTYDDICFLKPQIGNKRETVFNIARQQEIHQHTRDVLLVCHGMLGCDTLSAKAGEEFILAMYGASRYKTLDQHRLYVYNQQSVKGKLQANSDLATLPPTTAAASQHSLRVYHQVQQW